MKKSEEYFKRIYKWIEENGLSQHGGATLYQFCEVFDINHQSHYNWLEEFPEYKEGVSKARGIFKAKMIGELTNALKKKALGYEDVKTEMYGYMGEDGNFHTEKARRIKVNVPPDTGASVFLLTNLDPDNWKNRQDTSARIEEVQRADIQVKDEEQKKQLEQARNGIRRKR